MIAAAACVFVDTSTFCNFDSALADASLLLSYFGDRLRLVTEIEREMLGLIRGNRFPNFARLKWVPLAGHFGSRPADQLTTEQLARVRQVAASWPK